MRKVVYFKGGVVADFPVPDDRFDDFSRNMDFKSAHDTDGLDKARLVLDAFLGEGGGDKAAGPEETLAACYVWNFFNTHTDDEMAIEGDVMIIDLDGTGTHIDYASVKDIGLEPAN